VLHAREHSVFTLGEHCDARAVRGAVEQPLERDFVPGRDVVRAAHHADPAPRQLVLKSVTASYELALRRWIRLGHARSERRLEVPME
jgi:hypothetical protein